MKYFKQALQLLFHGRAISLKDFKVWEDFVVFGQVQAFSKGEFKDDGLTRKDRTRMITSNFPLVIEYYQARRLLDEVDGYERDLDEFLMGLDPVERRRMVDVHLEISQNGILQPKRLG